MHLKNESYFCHDILNSEFILQFDTKTLIETIHVTPIIDFSPPFLITVNLFYNINLNFCCNVIKFNLNWYICAHTTDIVKNFAVIKSVRIKEGYLFFPFTDMPGRVAQSVTCLATDAYLTADPGVTSSIPVWSHTFVEINHEIISTVMLLPSADSFKKGCCQLQAKVCARSTG